MFDLLISQLKHIDLTKPIILLVPAGVSLPHETIMHEAGLKIPHDFSLDTFAAEAGFNIETVAEDHAMLRINIPYGYQLFAAGARYRQKLLNIAVDCDLPALNKLHTQLAIYDEYIQQIPVLTVEANEPIQALAVATTKLMVDTGLPLEDTDWPQSRNKLLYQQLHYPKLLRNFRANNLLLPVASGAKSIVDAGLGDGIALAEFKAEHSHTIGIGLHQIAFERSSQIDNLCYSPIPNGKYARELFETLRGSIDIVFDTYGPGTYAENPVHALIYLGLLLREGGQANIIISSVHGESIDQSPIGYAATRKKLIALFKNELNMEMVIRRTFINSLVQPGVICKDFHIEIRREQFAPARSESLDALLELADKLLGKVSVIFKQVSWGNFKTGFKILGKAYGENTSPYNWRDDLASVHMDYVVQAGIGIRFHYQFKHEASYSEFNTQFSEFFAHHKNPDWQITPHDEQAVTTIVYYDKSIDERVIAHQFGANDHGWTCLYQEDMAYNFKCDTLPPFSAEHINHCLLQARTQLQETLGLIPGVADIKGDELKAEKAVVTLYSDGAACRLFTPRDTPRSVDRFKEQYVYKM